MRPTRRGWTALVVVAAAMVMSWQFGPRALNAVVAPLIVVLVAGVVATVRVDRPTVRRVPVAEGAVGERRTAELVVESDATVSATVSDAVGDGLSVLESEGRGTATVDDDTPVVETTLTDTNRFAYDVRLEARGERRLGPVSITVTDVLGLVERRFRYEESTTTLVYPRVRDVRAGHGDALQSFADAVAGRDREAFDHLREYQRGDSLRDVHWKSAAKRPDADLVVTEYAADEDTGTVTIAADCVPGRDDELATAVASVADFLLEAGVDVGVVLPDTAYEPGSGGDHRRDLLAAFAVLEAGELEESIRESADVLIRVDDDGTAVVLDDRTIPFERLVGERESGVVP
ncbi:DUF58 domain-containing protein [Natronolimnohabitans sp. A-GB9]|uniref:DUF58 domain-containing protein n=1 Tax=Natronolimnohabitans sp. A-GB9 TaxID=3069757 RepID=UPI0027AE8B3F|nr:DUF58 domain-containing protein [Natronolimnohabitans sp. A-GB9]MDQ2051177.1 DUF58 domain-containing protein [Natronolimnohabitans sp. A-GB9]